jgi:hypothetical protein
MAVALILATAVAVAAAAAAGDPMNVFMVAHSHCDLGWVRTPEEYYAYEVSNILNTTMGALRDDASKTLKFHWCGCASLRSVQCCRCVMHCSV